MIPYVDKIIADFPEKITGHTSSPAADHLFTVRHITDTKLLPEVQATAFHHTTAQLLFLSRVRRDIQTTVAFLTTRVKSPDEDDWGKLKRVLKYLHSTRRLPLSLSADSLSTIIWYVDASHQTHDDCKGHTGSILTLGNGAITSTSTKQKIPSKSSTESELIGLYDKSSDILWTRHFLEAQGYTISANIVFQDNMSTLSLAKNGHVSSSKRTKHIKAKYLYVRHYHNSGELDLRFCPTEEMWADVLTKPLQGSKFRQFRAFLMNCALDYNEDPPFVPLQPISSNVSINTRRCSPKLKQPKPLSRECVETQSVGSPMKNPGPLKPMRKDISWRDSLFPRHHLTTTPSRGHAPSLRIAATAE